MQVPRAGRLGLLLVCSVGGVPLEPAEPWHIQQALGLNTTSMVAGGDLKPSQKWDFKPQAAASGGGKANCDETVAYLFMTPDGLPLESIWMEYFGTCPEGSYTVHVHSQQSTHIRWATSMVDKPTQGDLRFSYGMQDAMMKLYRQAGSHKAPNGCSPSWYQMLSESCAPLIRCDAAHKLVAAQPGKSKMEAFQCNLMSDDDNSGKNCAGIRIPPAFHSTPGGPWKASQWSTLWHEHARVLLDNEDSNRALWDTICPDEHYSVNTLKKMGKEVIPSGLTLTMVSEENNGHAQNVKCPSLNTLLNTWSMSLNLYAKKHAHARFSQQNQHATLLGTPPTNPQTTREASSTAAFGGGVSPVIDAVFNAMKQEGKVFARKFGPDCIKALQELIAQGRALKLDAL